MKKRLLAVFLVCCMALPFAGCGAKTEKVTISHCQGEWCWPILDEIAADYKQATGTEIEYIYVPAEGYGQWQSAQFMAGSEPDLVWGPQNVQSLYNNGKIIPLTSYFEAENPHSGQRWEDDFIDGVLQGCKDDKGADYIATTLSRTQVNLYYNKDIFEELQLEAPKTWSDVLSVSKAIKEKSGYIPFSVMNSTPWNLSWITNNFCEDFYVETDIADRLDVIKPNGKLEDSEILLGMKSGLLKFTDEPFVDMFRFEKEMVPYYNEGFNAVGWEFESLFDEGKAAMALNGSWYPNQHMTGNKPVNYGIAIMPYVDDSISPNVRNQPVKYMSDAGEAGAVVTKKAQKEGRADKAVDFMQYLSNAKGAGQKWVDQTMNLPVIKNVTLPEKMKEFETMSGDTVMRYNAGKMLAITPEANTKYNEMFITYLEDDMTAEEFAEQVQRLFDGYIDEAIDASVNIDVRSYLDKVK